MASLFWGTFPKKYIPATLLFALGSDNYDAFEGTFNVIFDACYLALAFGSVVK